MPEAIPDSGPRTKTFHLDDCPVCAAHDRARAYRWLGENHWIPGLHGASWLGQDLRRALGQLEIGQQTEFDYTDDSLIGPRITVRRSADDVITASAPDIPEPRRWTWQPSNDPERIVKIAFELLTYLQSQRGARQVILIPPRGDASG